nr:hypothetical protein [Ferrimicrobium acidiphilum]
MSCKTSRARTEAAKGGDAGEGFEEEGRQAGERAIETSTHPSGFRQDYRQAGVKVGTYLDRRDSTMDTQIAVWPGVGFS